MNQADSNTKSIRLATAFSGIGAVETAMGLLDLKNEIVFAGDIDEFCKETYFANYKINEEKWHSDVRKFDATQYKDNVDIFVGGSPCQSFSVMGKRKGLDEARGTLFYEFARIISECNPKVFIYENVTGMLNHDNGNTWNVIKNIFDELNYLWTYWVLNAKDFGLPQNRNRIFVVGFQKELSKYFKKLKQPSIIPLKSSVEDFLDDYVPNKYYLPIKGFLRVTNPKESKHIALNHKVSRCQVACQQYNWFGDMRFESHIPERIENDKRIHKGIFNGVRGVTRTLTPRECLRLMGFPNSFNIVVNDTQVYRQSGNSIAVNVIAQVVQSIVNTGIFHE